MKEEKNALSRVLKIFSGIDEKIMFLHKCSSDDFLSLNKSLKENYISAKYITEQSKSAFEKTGEDGNLKLLGLLKANIENFKQEIIEFESETDYTLLSLERIQSNFSLMFVPLNNFRQNLTSLKLLLSNIKLTNTFFDKSIKSFSESEALHIEKIINKVKESCPVFEENIYNIQKHLKPLYTELKELKESLLANVLNKFEAMQVEMAVIEKHSLHAQRNKNRIDEITASCSKKVGSIITNLQYHDIIRQKMEHIQKTHKYILEEIHSSSVINGKAGISPDSCVLQIPQIAEIQVGQLLHTNKEYQQAIEHISHKMIEIARDMTEMVRICKSLDFLTNRESQYDSPQPDESIGTLAQTTKKGLEKYGSLSEEISLVNRIVTDLYHKYQDLDMIESAVEQRIIDKINFGELLLSPEKETATQAQQILKLYADNHFEKSKLKTLFESTRQELKEFLLRNLEYTREKRGVEKLNEIAFESEVIFNSIDENLQFLANIQIRLSEKNEEINHTSKVVLEGVKYYDCFEKTIEELIISFGEISLIIKSNNLFKVRSASDYKGLEQIEQYYTMKSERIIHNQYIHNSRFGDDMVLIDNAFDIHPEKDGNDMEFFLK